jgi:mono/diheme cytochrome c family protein
MSTDQHPRKCTFIPAYSGRDTGFFDNVHIVIGQVAIRALLLSLAWLVPASALPASDQEAYFTTTVHPLLEARCFSCHGEKKQKGGLRLDSLSALLSGGDSGPAAVAGNLSKSLMIQAVKRIGDVQMPPKEPMPAEEVAILEKWVAGGLAWPGAAAPMNAEMSAMAKDAERLEKTIRPLLAEHCYECHDSNESASGLDLSSRTGLLAGGKRGPAAVPGKPEESLFISALKHSDAKLKMPNKKDKLSDKDIATLEQWIADGIPWPENAGITIVATGGPEFTITEKQRSHWSLQPIADPALPTVKNRAWVKDPIDTFVAAGQEASGVKPAPPADKATLIRRATYDLTGLPPTPEEITAFLADSAPDAFDRVIDRLLASPRYGERGARHWLDLVRYADAINYDPKYTHFPAYTIAYRNWVIRALNDDVPYDRFLTMQLAGDLLPKEQGGGRDGIIATGVLTLGNWQENDTEREKVRADMVDDQIDLVGRAFMGLSVSCARCHNHKFDPISQADYTALAGIFFSTRIADGKSLRIRYELEKDGKKSAKAIEDKEISPARRKKEHGTAPTDEERAAYRSKPLTIAYRAEDGGIPGSLHAKIGDTRLYIRGSFQKQGDVIPRRFPEVLAGTSQQPIGTDRSGRLELAKWLTKPDHPLTARVMVNRIWQHHFGNVGLVRTPSDFGLRGEAPTDPALLDHLARRFIASGWSLKAMHRAILKSATWQQASVPLPESFSKDPENRLLTHQNRWRLEAEAVRDSLLAVSNTLNTDVGDLPPWPKQSPTWRTIFLHVSRFDADAFWTTFDGAEPCSQIARRETSIVPQQALWMMNNPLPRNAATKAAERAGTGDEDAITRLHLLLLGRQPDTAELTLAKAFLAKGADRAAQWKTYAHALVCSNDFIFVD